MTRRQLRAVLAMSMRFTAFSCVAKISRIAPDLREEVAQ
ncbi:hypothetical protein O23A_p2189 [Aeromonas salmonicida]|nr:hypothetical protein O23A_p2189 [Aeromonas salmonicida]